MNFIKYNSYKHSDLEWIKLIPNTWRICRVKDLGSLQNGISKGREYFGFGAPFVNYGNVYNDSIELKHINTYANSNIEEQKQYSVREGDVFFTRTSETIDEIGISATAESTIPKATFSGFVIRLRPASKFIYKGYSKYFFKGNINRLFLSKEISLVTRASLSQNTLNSLPVLLPPYPEQQAIAQYLDTKTQAIDKKIALLQRKIDHYRDFRKSLINETVTKGLDKNAPLKDSGIGWIGQIPQHWEVKRLKEIGFFESSSINKKIEENEDLIKIINYVDVYNNTKKEIWNSDKYMIVSANKSQIQSKRLKKGDAIFTPSSETIEDIGVSAIVMENLHNTLYSYHVLRFRFSTEIDINFKKYMLNNDFIQTYFSQSSTGTTRKILGLNSFNNLQVLVPKTTEEQKNIGAFLNKKSEAVNNLITNLQSQISTLTELRKTLINDVVTGKIKVVEWVIKLSTFTATRAVT